MRIVILGGTGFIGPQLVRALYGHDITLLHRHPTASASGRVSHIACDRAELPRMRAVFEALRPDCVIDMMAQNEASAQEALAMIAPFAGRVVMVSSASVYRQFGRLLRIEPAAAQSGPATEAAPLRARLFPYRRTSPRAADDPRFWMDSYDKIPAETAYLSHPDIAASIVRLPMVFGADDPDARVGRYVERMLSGAAEIRLTASVAAWHNARGHVGNVAEAIAVVASGGQAGRIYNIADGFDLPEAEWVERIGYAAGWHGRVIPVADGDPAGIAPLDELPADADFSVHLRLDTRRIRSELGFAEPVSLDEALRRTVTSVQRSPEPLLR